MDVKLSSGLSDVADCLLQSPREVKRLDGAAKAFLVFLEDHKSASGRMFYALITIF